MTRRAWISFAAISLIWGIPYLFIRIAVRHGFTPASLAWARVALASIVLLALDHRAGTLHQLKGRWRWLAFYALVETSLPFPLIAFGEQRVSSSLAAIIIAAVPLIGTLLALRFDHSERPTPLRFAGLVLGFGGVIALVGIDVAGNASELLGTGAILIAAVGYAIGPMVIKHRFAGLDSRAVMGASLGICALFLTPLTIADPPSHVPSAGAIASVVVLGLLCTAAAFLIFMVLIREAGTSRATVITYVNPVVAVALGVTLLNESPGPGAVAGLLLILAGSWLSTGGKLPPGVVAWLGRVGRRTAAEPAGVERVGRRTAAEPAGVERVGRRTATEPAGLERVGRRTAGVERVERSEAAKAAWSPNRQASRNLAHQPE